MSTWIQLDEAHSLEVDDHENITINRRNMPIEYISVGSSAHPLWMAVLAALDVANTKQQQAAHDEGYQAGLRAGRAANTNSYDNGYRAGMQHVRSQIAAGQLPPGFRWESVFTSRATRPEDAQPEDRTAFRRMVGPEIPVDIAAMSSDESIAELRRRLSGS